MNNRTSLTASCARPALPQPRGCGVAGARARARRGRDGGQARRSAPVPDPQSSRSSTVALRCCSSSRASHKRRRPRFRCGEVTRARSRGRSNQSGLAVEGPETAVYDVGQDRFEVRLGAVDTAIPLCDTLSPQPSSRALQRRPLHPRRKQERSPSFRARVRNTIRLQDTGASFEQLTEPTPTEARAFELIDAHPLDA
jgi:hypothetical protein